MVSSVRSQILLADEHVERLENLSREGLQGIAAVAAGHRDVRFSERRLDVPDLNSSDLYRNRLQNAVASFTRIVDPDMLDAWRSLVGRGGGGGLPRRQRIGRRPQRDLDRCFHGPSASFRRLLAAGYATSHEVCRASRRRGCLCAVGYLNATFRGTFIATRRAARRQRCVRQAALAPPPTRARRVRLNDRARPGAHGIAPANGHYASTVREGRGRRSASTSTISSRPRAASSVNGPQRIVYCLTAKQTRTNYSPR